MEVFDKKYVYYLWDNELEGEKCLLSDNAFLLKEFVNNCNDLIHQDSIVLCDNVTYSGENRYPFASKTSRYSFCYYDPNIELKIAAKNGKRLQWSDDGKIWNDSPEFDCLVWDDNCFWRIKSNVRPFHSGADLIQYYLGKVLGQNYVKDLSVEKPVIWVRYNDGTYNNDYMITGFDDEDTVLIDSHWVDMTELLEKYTFLNGMPCGVKEE